MTNQNSVTRRGFLARTVSYSVGGVTASRLATSPALVAAQTAGAWRVGCYTRPWDKHDYRLALDAIAEAGFKHAGLMSTSQKAGRLVISVDTTPEEAETIGREVSSRGMAIPSVYGGPIPVNQSLEAGIAGLKKLIDACVAAGAKSLLMGGMGRASLYETYYKAIGECCGYAAEKGLPITVKPHGGLNATGAQCRKCLETVGSKNFSLWYDPGNIYFYSDGKRNPVEDAATVDGLVTVGMCIKDFSMSTEGGRVSKDVWVTPGTGMVNFPAVMANLKKGGFTGGDLVIETVTRPDPNDLKAILAEARKARKFVEALVSN